MKSWLLVVSFIFIGLCNCINININVNSNVSMSTLPDTYLSVSIDSSQLVGSHFWSTDPKPFNFSRPRLINMAKALSPAVLRVGGTDGDKVKKYFKFNLLFAKIFLLSRFIMIYQIIL